MPKSANQARVNIYVHPTLRKQVMQALRIRSSREAVNGRVVATTFSAWVREAAVELIAKFR